MQNFLKIKKPFNYFSVRLFQDLIKPFNYSSYFSKTFSTFPKMSVHDIPLPENIFLLGYGAIGKCFTEILFHNFPKAKVTVLDLNSPPADKRFKYIQLKISKDNIGTFLDYVGKGDILVDLSTNIDCLAIWSLCVKKGVMYLNTAMEEWEDSENPTSFPKNFEELYKTTLLFRHDEVKGFKIWDAEKGATTVFEHGMNPGLISHFAKTGILDAARYFLKNQQNEEFKDLDFKEIERWLNEKNYSKLAQALGLHTIHCSEMDDQLMKYPPTDTKKKFYNTWSCRGFLTEGMVPIQVARGSHEDAVNKEYPRVHSDKLIMSWAPSNHFWAKSWVPFQDIEGCLIPHGEAVSISEFFSDKETGYSPSQYYVYDINPHAYEFISNLKKNATLQDVDPEMEVIHPLKYEMKGYDIVGAFLIFNNNRGWWAGTIMDQYDSSYLFDYKFGPTVLQVGGGVFSAFVWMCKNPLKGNKWAENLDSELILEVAKPYLGRVYSDFVDLKKTHIKDCKKFESFITKKYEH